MNCTIKSDIKLYRVVVLPNQVLSVSKGYQEILNNSYFSEKTMAKHHQNVLFVIEKSAQHAVDIQNLSPYSEKRHYLLAPMCLKSLKLNKMVIFIKSICVTRSRNGIQSAKEFMSNRAP